MTDIDQLVERMESAAKAATPGEWSKASDQYDRPRVIDEYNWTLCDMSTLAPNGPRFKAGDDAAHIAIAQPQNVLALIAEWRSQKAGLEAAEARASGVQEVLDRYHQALVDREHGGHAIAKLVEGLEAELNTSLEDYRARKALETD